MKKIIAMSGVLFFLVSLIMVAPRDSYALNPQPEPPAKSKSGLVTNETYAGTIIKIAGTKITIRDDAGKERIIESNIVGFKAGDRIRITVRDGRTWLNPQPEPPIPIKPKKINR